MGLSFPLCLKFICSISQTKKSPVLLCEFESYAHTDAKTETDPAASFLGSAFNLTEVFLPALQSPVLFASFQPSSKR